MKTMYEMTADRTFLGFITNEQRLLRKFIGQRGYTITVFTINSTAMFGCWVKAFKA